MSSVAAIPSFDQRSLRVSILGAFWAITLLALPLWWSTTNIERLSLPSISFDASLNPSLFFPVRVALDNVYFSSSFASEVQDALRSKIISDTHTSHIIAPYVVSSNLVHAEESNYNVTLKSSTGLSEVSDRVLRVSGSADHQPRPEDVANTLLSLLSLQSRTEQIGSSARLVAKLAPRYRLAFSLLNEDAASGVAASSWHITGSLEDTIKPTLDRLHELHNFTIESQVRFHAPLAFEPLALSYNGGSMHGLTPEHLTVFVNSADWILASSVTEDPVLHFIVFVPSVKRRPLHILDVNYAPIASQSFIIPQWGGVFIYNPPEGLLEDFRLTTAELSPIFMHFRDQLSALLGIPALPNDVINVDHHVISDWQLDSLIRRRAREAVDGSKATLQSIGKLVNQIENMPVGPNVRDDVRGALRELRHIERLFDAREVLKRASRALELTSRAFFSPGMLAMLYFPAEHKYAVYSPFFLPVMMFLVMGIIREFKDWKRSKQTSDSRT